MGDGERVGVKAFVPWTLSPCQSITHDFLFSLALPSKLWTNWSSVFSQHISRRRSHFLASHNWSEMLQQYKRQIDGKKWSRKSTLENSSQRKKEKFSSWERFFFSVSGIATFIHSLFMWRIRLRSHTLRSIFVCNCTRFIIVSWTCSIIKIVSTLETELLALESFQVEVGSCILLPTQNTRNVTHTHYRLHCATLKLQVNECTTLCMLFTGRVSEQRLLLLHRMLSDLLFRHFRPGDDDADDSLFKM